MQTSREFTNQSDYNSIHEATLVKTLVRISVPRLIRISETLIGPQSLNIVFLSGTTDFREKYLK